MKTRALRLYGKDDLRVDEFELPEMGDDQIIAHIISDSICMSSYKAAKQGGDHKRVPNDVETNPVIIGHEFCGEIVRVGKKWKHKYKEGMRFSIQPALNYKGSLSAPGYSYHNIGGAATYVLVPNEVMEMDCLLDYKGDAFFFGSLSEPMSCIVGAFHASFHIKPGTYVHDMGIKEGGRMAILAGVGPMGLGAIDYALHSDRKPSQLVVTDIDDDRLKRAAQIHTVENAAENGVELHYVNTNNSENPARELISITAGAGYDDVLVMAPVKPVVEQADKILGRNGCLNFFAGPSNTDFTASLNFYNVHYESHLLVGTSGGNTDDMKESLKMMEEGRINPAAMITHIGGLDSAAETTLNLPNIPGGKKLIYTNLSLELTALADLKEKGVDDPLFAELAVIVEKNNGLWSSDAEKYLLENGKSI